MAKKNQEEIVLQTVEENVSQSLGSEQSTFRVSSWWQSFMSR